MWTKLSYSLPTHVQALNDAMSCAGALLTSLYLSFLLIVLDPRWFWVNHCLNDSFQVSEKIFWYFWMITIVNISMDFSIKEVYKNHIHNYKYIIINLWKMNNQMPYISQTISLSYNWWQAIHHTSKWIKQWQYLLVLRQLTVDLWIGNDVWLVMDYDFVYLSVLFCKWWDVKWLIPSINIS